MKRVLFGAVFLVACLSMSSLVFAQCVVPTDGMIINSETVLCNGFYNIPNGLTIGSDRIILNCNGATLNDNTFDINHAGIRIFDKQNVVIENCTLKNFERGIDIEKSSFVNVFNNTLWNSSILFFTSYNNVIKDNILSGIGPPSELLLNGAIGNTIINNIFTNHEIVFWQGGHCQDYSCSLEISYPTPINNKIYNNTFHIYGIYIVPQINENYNDFCVNGIGNTYLNGATGPTCLTTENLEPRVSALESWRITIDTWKTTIDSWKSTIDSTITNIWNELTNHETRISALEGVTTTTTTSTTSTTIPSTTTTTSTTTTIPTTTTTISGGTILYQVSSGCHLYYGLSCPSSGYSRCEVQLDSAPCAPSLCNCPVTFTLQPGRNYKSSTGCPYTVLTAGCKMTGFV